MPLWQNPVQWICLLGIGNKSKIAGVCMWNLISGLWQFGVGTPIALETQHEWWDDTFILSPDPSWGRRLGLIMPFCFYAQSKMFKALNDIGPKYLPLSLQTLLGVKFSSGGPLGSSTSLRCSVNGSPGEGLLCACPEVVEFVPHLPGFFTV